MNNKELFEQFNKGKLCLPEGEINYATIEWLKHPTFEGVEIKHIITSKQTEGQFSFHLVRIAPNKKIGLHIHEKELETHEVIAGSGTCLNNGVELTYTTGVSSIFAMGALHEVIAGSDGLYLFAKFFPALC